MSSAIARTVLTPFRTAGPFLVLLLALPVSLAAQPSPDRAALSAAAELKRKGASAGKVATEVTRSYRQTAGQTAVILQEVGFSGVVGTRALVRDLRLDPEKAAWTLREARYPSRDVASGLSRAGLASDRVVAALGAGRYRLSEIVEVQQSVLRLDTKAAWADLKRSGLLKTSADELMEAFLRLNLQDPNGGPETHELVTTVGRDVLDFGAGVGDAIGGVFKKVGLTLRARLAALRDIYGWTAAEALAWLSGETSFESALQMVDEEYGLDTPGLVEAVLGVLNETQATVDRVTAFALLLLHEQDDAREELLQGLNEGGASDDELAQALLEVHGQVSDVADLMVSTGLWSVETAGEWLLASGAAVEDVVVWLRSKNFTGEEVADALVEAGRPVGEVAIAVGSEFAWTTRDAARWLLGTATDVIDVMVFIIGLTAPAPLELAQALEAAGVPLDQIWSGLVSVMDLTPAELVQVMSAMGRSTDQIAARLVELFSMPLAEALALVAQIVGG